MTSKRKSLDAISGTESGDAEQGAAMDEQRLIAEVDRLADVARRSIVIEDLETLEAYAQKVTWVANANIPVAEPPWVEYPDRPMMRPTTMRILDLIPAVREAKERLFLLLNPLELLTDRSKSADFHIAVCQAAEAYEDEVQKVAGALDRAVGGTSNPPVKEEPPRLEVIRDLLSVQEWRLFEYLIGRSHGSAYETLADIEGAWNKPLDMVSDAAINRKIDRINDKLADAGWTIERRDRRAKVIDLLDK